MDRRRVGGIVRVLLGVGCFVMAGLSLSGVVSRGYPNERLIFGIGWAVIGAGWIGRLYIGRKNSEQARREGRDL